MEEEECQGGDPREKEEGGDPISQAMPRGKGKRDGLTREIFFQGLGHFRGGLEAAIRVLFECGGNDRLEIGVDWRGGTLMDRESMGDGARRRVADVVEDFGGASGDVVGKLTAGEYLVEQDTE